MLKVLDILKDTIRTRVIYQIDESVPLSLLAL